MPVAIDTDLYASGAGLPTPGNYVIELLGQRFLAARELSPCDHKVDKTTVVANGGESALGTTTGILNPDAEGSFVLYVDGAKRFRTLLQALAPMSRLTEIPFVIRAYAIDPLTLAVRSTHTSLGCTLTNSGRIEKMGAGAGNEAQTATFTYKCTKEIPDGASVAK